MMTALTRQERRRRCHFLFGYADSRQDVAPPLPVKRHEISLLVPLAFKLNTVALFFKFLAFIATFKAQ